MAMKKIRLLICALLAALTLMAATGCCFAQETALTITDDLGRTVDVPHTQRTGVLVGSFADIWCLAGGRDTIAAAANDSWTNFNLGLPENVVNIGSAKSPNAELLLSAAPDLVIASSNTKADLELMDTLEAAGIPALYFDVETFADYLRVLEIFTRITGNTDAYETWGLSLTDTVESALARQDGSAPSVLYLRATGSAISVKGSSGNLLGEMLAEFGCVNIADAGSKALEDLSMEAIMLEDPDYIFVVIQATDPTEAQALVEKTLLSDPAWNTLMAVRSGRFYTLDNALYNLKPNARWGEAYEGLADILYPAQ